MGFIHGSKWDPPSSDILDGGAPHCGPLCAMTRVRRAAADPPSSI
jgi:hypothetical protein